MFIGIRNKAAALSYHCKSFTEAQGYDRLSSFQQCQAMLLAQRPLDLEHGSMVINMGYRGVKVRSLTSPADLSSVVL